MYSFVNAALKANSWTFDAKTKAIKIWPETKAWPPGYIEALCQRASM